MNQTADFPKTMGFNFTLKPHTHDEYMYQLYVAEKAERVQVDLYNPDTLLFDRTLLTLTDVDTGTHEGNVKKEDRSEEHTSELQSRFDLVCRLLLEKKNK